MASVDQAFALVADKFEISSLNEHQKTAIKQIVEKEKDVLVNLPTGFGKSLIFQALPTVFDHVRSSPGHIVVVVSPLINLMDDQVKFLGSLGITAVNISSCSEEERFAVEQGKFSVVYGSPEAWLKNERWRAMLHNEVFSRKLCAVAVDEAHVVRQWGTSQHNKMAAFRESYSKLYEFRSLAPNTPIIALTATATRLTRDTIVSVLQMERFVEITESPNKVNITYAVQYMEKDIDHEEYFVWLADELKAKQQSCPRAIIYCQTIKQCGIVYGLLKGLLGKESMVNSDGDALLEMLHSCTPEANKKSVLESFRDGHGSVRLLVATIAFGMGIDCKGVSRVVHYGPSKNIEAYVQETGRAGRGGEQSVAYILYHGILLNHVESDIKSFLKTSDCRRKTLLKHFEAESEIMEVLHSCCDNCASKCKCGMADCSTVKYPMPDYKNDDFQGDSKERDVTVQYS